MGYSPLVSVNVPADGSNYTPGRCVNVDKITVHHMAGVMSAEDCGHIFQRPGRGGSSNYGIGVNGEIGVYVDEDSTSWADSNWSSNCRSITIENSNSATGGDWPVSDATLDSLIKLCADIAKRHGMGTLIPGQNLTWHNMYVPTTCPGPYLQSRMQYIADKANEINGRSPEPAPAPQPPQGGFAAGDEVVPKDYVDYYGTRLLKTRDSYFISSISGDRAVLSADHAGGPVYAAMNTNNLNKVGGGSPAPAPSGSIGVGSQVVPINYVSYEGIPLLKTRDFYYVNSISGDRAVLAADNQNGPIYAAMNINNLSLVGGGASAPSGGINVGDRVTLNDWVDVNGTRLAKTRDFYYVSEMSGDRAVLRADSMNGPVYAAVNKNNLRKV